MPTTRLYFDDPLLFDFEALVLEHAEHQGRPSLLLEQSAFYPEGGGQLPDAGVIAGVQVVDVQVDAAGNVHHVLAGERPDVGARVAGRVDRARRRLHMAEHTAQHVLSRALADVVGAETLSARLGESACTIDVDRADLGDGELGRAESLALSVVDDDVPIRAFFPSPEELRALPLRRAPKVDEQVRVVQVGDFDVTPCGGTHCTHSSQIGVVRVVASERYKGGTRVTFTAGVRGRTLLSTESSLLRSLGQSFTCGPAEVGAAVERLRRELDSARGELGKTRAELAELKAGALIESARTRGESTVVALLEGAGAELLRTVGARITESPESVAILAGSAADGLPVFVARGSASSFDCGGFVKRLAARTGGRGGGRPERAEGRLPAGSDFVSEARALLAE
jgi:alanyl-tRNA synthetase